MTKHLLVLNCGSSSVKFNLFALDAKLHLQAVLQGIAEEIGNPAKSRLKYEQQGARQVVTVPLAMHRDALVEVFDVLEKIGIDRGSIVAVGHRVVHGGETFASSVLITDEVMKAIQDCIPFAPLHNPANITGIEACKKVMGSKVPQVAVFDTAFHQTMPGKAYMYAIPYEYYEKDKIRRYGFHGTSHRYVTARAAEMLGKPIEELKLISCHMGNGSSICAVDHGKSVDTSMGFTPLVGLPMGTRCGQMDMGGVQYIMDKYGYNIDQMLEILNKKSGVLGVSGVSSDFRDLDEAAAKGNERAKLALDMFNYWVAKTVGGYAAAMNGVDAIIFTAGIGENSKSTRAAICEYFGYLGATLDPAANDKRGEDTVISTADSRVKLLVIPTDEELVIARDTKGLVTK